MVMRQIMVFSVFISTASLLTVKTINDISYTVFKFSHIKSTPLPMPTSSMFHYLLIFVHLPNSVF